MEELIYEYHVSEGLTPRRDRIAWAVEQQLSSLSPGLLLVARDGSTPIGVALAVYTPSAELGSVMTVNDFYVRPGFRRKGVGRKMAKRLVERSRLLEIDEINLEVIAGNRTAASFWRAMGFELADRALFKVKLAQNTAEEKK